MPALVHLDPVLDAVDSRVFAVLWIRARQEGRGPMAFPSYEHLMGRCHIRSRATLARSLAILRICRWITLCRRVRDERGRNRGNIYALHEEPLALSSTVYLDHTYMEFLHQATRHRHARVREIACALIESLEKRIEEGENLLDDLPAAQAGRRLQAMETATGKGPGPYFAFHHRSIAALQAWRKSRANGPSCRVQNMHPDRVQNLNPAVCSSSSSSNLIKTTTTPRAAEDSGSAEGKTSLADLAYPEPLSANERLLAQMYLKGLEAELQQALLDELAEKLRRQAKTDRPVRNPVGLLSWMCQEARAGRPPLTSDHLRCRERRVRERYTKERIEAEQRRLTEMALQRVGTRPLPGMFQRVQGASDRGNRTQ